MSNPNFPPPGQGFPPMGTPPGTLPTQGGYPPMGGFPPAGGSLPMGGVDPLAAKTKSKSKKSKGRTPKRTPERAATKRVVGTQRLLAFLAAAAAALALLVSVGPKSSGTYEVRVNANVGALTSISQSQLIATPVSGTTMVNGAFTAHSAAAAISKAMSYAQNKTVAVQLTANQELSTHDFSANSGVVLGGGQLVSLDATVAGAVGGTLNVNDQVDVIGTVNNAPATLAAGATIVSIMASQDQYNSAAQAQTSNRTANPNDLLPSQPVPGIYILKVTPSEAKAIAAVQGSASASGLALVYCQQGSC